MRWWFAALILAACPGPKTDPVEPTPGSGSAPVVTPTPPPIDAPEPSQEERLAAIQKAMNELDEGVQGCWAAVAAAERFDVEGELVAMIEIGAAKSAVSIVRDTARNQRLAACVGELLGKYTWTPPLYGQAIQLPFKFNAPVGGQNVIDRSLVPWKAQAKIGVAVLLDENTSGNGAASMFELALQQGGATGPRSTPRAELWYFLGPASVQISGTANKREVAAGDMMYVPANGARDVVASAGDVHAVIVAVPGGREGAARAGALPTPEIDARAKLTWPTHLPAASAKSYPRPAGKVTIFAEPATIKDKGVSASVIELPSGAAIPEHVHPNETELLYVLAGSGTMTVNGVKLAVTPTSVVQIPPNTKHAFSATADVRAVQIYTPAGPEQRFKQK